MVHPWNWCSEGLKGSFPDAWLISRSFPVASSVVFRVRILQRPVVCCLWQIARCVQHFAHANRWPCNTLLRKQRWGCRKGGGDRRKRWKRNLDVIELEVYVAIRISCAQESSYDLLQKIVVNKGNWPYSNPVSSSSRHTLQPHLEVAAEDSAAQTEANEQTNGCRLSSSGFCSSLWEVMAQHCSAQTEVHPVLLVDLCVAKYDGLEQVCKHLLLVSRRSTCI